ncbi:MAG: hypothetical protein JRF60_14075 [Deltaproteobacteria bacterium]|nr:hypothetical protein [Deltaproteobacteria bacterium]
MEAKQPFSDQDWQATPEPVRQYIRQLEQTIAMLVNTVKELEKRIEKLESKTNQNSQNSSKPPSSDSPFKKPKKKRKKSKRKKGAQKGHKGYKQQLLEPTLQQDILPEKCDCGCSTIIAGSLLFFLFFFGFLYGLSDDGGLLEF